MSKKSNDSGWQIATALQAAPAVMILCLLWFTPDSPRWLVFNDRYEDALKVLRKLRRKEDIDNGLPELEIASMREEGQVGKRQKGGWLELFNAKNRRRTGYVFRALRSDSVIGGTSLTIIKHTGLPAPS